MNLSDRDERFRCLTDFEGILVCEAAAGTGKTSLMAARIAMMLVSGIEPGAIAALTFTEPAASELARRIHLFVGELIEGRVPLELGIALPSGLAPEQLATLQAASQNLDALTSCTIHSFCLALITDHAVDAGLDPGATVADEFVATSMFDQAFDEWLMEVLSDESAPSESVLVLAEADPLGVVRRLRELAELRNRNRDARPPEVAPGARPDIELVDAIDELGRWVASHPADGNTTDWVEQLQTLREFYFDSLATPPDFRTLWRLGRPPRLSIMLRDSLGFREYGRLSAWRRILGDEGEKANREAKALIELVEERFSTLLGYLASQMVVALSLSLQGALDRYTELKRLAAVMDFDDLLQFARELLTTNEAARKTVGDRYRYIAVDEFQDTDTLQCEILFTVAAEASVKDWRTATLRPGSLFLVGDAKQSIYRFRKADIAAYEEARSLVLRQVGGAVVEIVANFRSRPQILDFVNDRFAGLFDGKSQPNYVPLAPTIVDAPGDVRSSVAKLSILDDATSPTIVRQIESVSVANLCQDLIGRFPVRRSDGTFSAATAGDIVLLAPGHTDLWRYERELENLHIAVSSQAGKSLMRRQETQDVLALLRTLSDPSDLLAFGALLRGPLVGLTDVQIADIAAGIPSAGGGTGLFGVLVDPLLIEDEYARSVVVVLQQLRIRSFEVTPSQLLAEAIERLGARLIVAARYGTRNARAFANLAALVDRAGRYAVSGLRSLVIDLQGQWDRLEPVQEGRGDTAENAVQIVTMHSAKGLEWPIVIPVARVTRFFPPPQFVHRRADDSLHWVLGELAPPSLAKARMEEEALQARERERMMYVVCTRARDLLVLPSVPAQDPRSWASAVRLLEDRLPEIDLADLPEEQVPPAAMVENGQDAALYARESAIVKASSPPISWSQPSSHDEKFVLTDDFSAVDSSVVTAHDVPVGAGAMRGTVLHKLIEELINGETVAEFEALAERAELLLSQAIVLYGAEQPELPDASELASTVISTTCIGDVERLWSHLVSEVSVWDTNGAVYVAGRVDALVLSEAGPVGIVDWKSDIQVSPSMKANYCAQVDAYLAATGAIAGVIVFMTTGEIMWRGDRDQLFQKCGLTPTGS